MPISRFDQMFYKFACENAECGEVFKPVLRELVNADEVVCPKCGTAIDIRESKRHGAIGKLFDTASELDKKAREKQ